MSAAGAASRISTEAASTNAMFFMAAELVPAALAKFVPPVPPAAIAVTVRVNIRGSGCVIVGVDVRIRISVRIIRISRVGVYRRANGDSETHPSLSRRAGQNQNRHQRHHRENNLFKHL